MKFKRRRSSTRSSKGKVGGFFLAVLIILTLGGLGFFLIPTKATRDFSYTTSTQIGSAKITNTISGSASALDVNGQVVSTTPFQTLSSVFTVSGTEIATVTISGTIEGSGTEIQLNTMQFTATYTAVIAGISVGPIPLQLTRPTDINTRFLFDTAISLDSFATAIESTATQDQADHILTITITVTGTVTSDTGTTITAQKSIYATLPMTWKKTMAAHETDPSFLIDVNLNVNDNPTTTTTATTTTSANVQKAVTSLQWRRVLVGTIGRCYLRLVRTDTNDPISGQTLIGYFSNPNPYVEPMEQSLVTDSSGEIDITSWLAYTDGNYGLKTVRFNDTVLYVGAVWTR